MKYLLLTLLISFQSFTSYTPTEEVENILRNYNPEIPPMAGSSDMIAEASMSIVNWDLFFSFYHRAIEAETEAQKEEVKLNLKEYFQSSSIFYFQDHNQDIVFHPKFNDVLFEVLIELGDNEIAPILEIECYNEACTHRRINRDQGRTLRANLGGQYRYHLSQHTNYPQMTFNENNSARIQNPVYRIARSLANALYFINFQTFEELEDIGTNPQQTLESFLHFREMYYPFLSASRNTELLYFLYRELRWYY